MTEDQLLEAPQYEAGMTSPRFIRVIDFRDKIAPNHVDTTDIDRAGRFLLTVWQATKPASDSWVSPWYGAWCVSVADASGLLMPMRCANSANIPMMLGAGIKVDAEQHRIAALVIAACLAFDVKARY